MLGLGDLDERRKTREQSKKGGFERFQQVAGGVSDLASAGSSAVGGVVQAKEAFGSKGG